MYIFDNMCECEGVKNPGILWTSYMDDPKQWRIGLLLRQMPQIKKEGCVMIYYAASRICKAEVHSIRTLSSKFNFCSGVFSLLASSIMCRRSESEGGTREWGRATFVERFGVALGGVITRGNSQAIIRRRRKEGERLRDGCSVVCN